MLNRVLITGNLGKDPEVKVLPSNTEVANLSVATSEYWKDKVTQEPKVMTTWVNVAVYNQGLIKYIKEYIKKGDLVYLEAKLQNRKWTDKDGKNHAILEITMNGPDCKLEKLNKKDKVTSESEVVFADISDDANHDDDIPF